MSPVTDKHEVKIDDVVTFYATQAEIEVLHTELCRFLGLTMGKPVPETDVVPAPANDDEPAEDDAPLDGEQG